MRYCDVETFVAIVHNRSISSAAKSLYITQPTASQRLKRLEDELGGALIVRKAGIKGVRLTSKGEKFLNVANQLLDIMRETKIITNETPFIPFSIGSIESLCILLPSLFEKLVRKENHIQLQTFTTHSLSVYQKLESRDLDIGFVTWEFNTPKLKCVPIFREKMKLVCRKDRFPANENVDVSTLNVHEEVFFSWNQEFNTWHEKQWDSGQKPLITMNTTVTYFSFLKHSDYWTICPESVAEYFLKENDYFDAYDIKNPPPDRTTYLISHNIPIDEQKYAFKIFETCLCEFLSEINSNIVCFNTSIVNTVY